MSFQDFSVIIPARYASSRLPAKLLQDLGGQPVIRRVYDRALASNAKQVIIATDDERIYDCAKTFGAHVIMTSVDCESGTERLAQAVEALELDDQEIIVNVQGDEPFIEPESIAYLAHQLSIDKQAKMATLAEALTEQAQIDNINNVKVIMDKNNHAIYFSRSVIPNQARSAEHAPCYYKHVGIYAYRCHYIKSYATLERSEIEQVESLEQLRALWHGDKILVLPYEFKSVNIGIDTQQDLDKAQQVFNAKSS